MLTDLVEADAQVFKSRGPWFNPYRQHNQENCYTGLQIQTIAVGKTAPK